jgi:KUP system potassium uptake protein
MLGGGAIAWHSKKQSTMATSTTEAEYSTLAAATREALWLSYLFDGLEVIDFESPTLIYSDNQAALTIARDPQHHARTKHFDVSNHFIREKVELGTIDVDYCPTDEMVADIFTKALPRVKFKKFRLELGLLPA